MSTAISKELVEATNKKVMMFFEQISKIPRGSGKEQRIADFLTDFAAKRKLSTKRSTQTINGKQTHDVVIQKPASNGYENCKTVILQAHIDMVCQKAEGVDHDFEKDPIETYKENGWMKAKGTTLGADDGIGVACMLAILDDDTLPHPPIEALFTSDEEDGMTGAMAVTTELVSGKHLINIDTETEGTLYYGCAGGIDAIFHLPVTHEPIPAGYDCLKIELSGLHGGHSGVEIHHGYANAHKLIARALQAVCDSCPALLVRFTGGDKRNVITQRASANVAVASDDIATVKKIIEEQQAVFKHEYEGIEEMDEKRIELTATEDGVKERQALSRESFKMLLSIILAMPNGVQAMHGKVEGLVETSCNLGIVRHETDSFYMCSLIRSFIRTKKLYVLEQMRQLAALTGAAFSFGGDYPDWEPNPESELIARFKHAYANAFSEDNQGAKEAKVESIHAGLECGYFTEKFPYMDMIACGPTITGAHTPKEALDIASTERVVKLLLTVLEQMKESLPIRVANDLAPKTRLHEHTHICQCVR